MCVLLQTIELMEDEQDINQIVDYFSYEHFYVIYCKFWELDTDHDLLISKEDLSRHNDHGELLNDINMRGLKFCAEFPTFVTFHYFQVMTLAHSHTHTCACSRARSALILLSWSAITTVDVLQICIQVKDCNFQSWIFARLDLLLNSNHYSWQFLQFQTVTLEKFVLLISTAFPHMACMLFWWEIFNSENDLNDYMSYPFLMHYPRLLRCMLYVGVQLYMCTKVCVTSMKIK